MGEKKRQGEREGEGEGERERESGRYPQNADIAHPEILLQPCGGHDSRHTATDDDPVGDNGEGRSAVSR